MMRLDRKYSVLSSSTKFSLFQHQGTKQTYTPYTLVGPTVTGPVQEPPSCNTPREPTIETK